MQVLSGGLNDSAELLLTGDNLTDPRVQFKRESALQSVGYRQQSRRLRHAHYALAATETADPCGNWFVTEWCFTEMPTPRARSGFPNAGPGPKRPAALAPELPSNELLQPIFTVSDCPNPPSILAGTWSSTRSG